MWGEFEDEEQDKRKECHQAQSSPERLCAASEIPGSTATKKDDMYALPLRDRLVHFLSTSNVEVKSQQKYEPDLTYEERKEIIEKLLNEKPGQFLYRFGKYLEREHLQYFLQYEGDVEVDHFLTETLKSKNKHTAKITVRNRRYAALQKMRKSGDYFSEEEMERRDPLLYDHLIGQHQTQEERDQKYSANSTEEKFSTLLLHHIDYRAHKELKKRQEDQEDDMLEEEDSDSDDDDDDDDGDAEMDSGIESREKQMFKEEFYSAGYNAFIRGENKDFDYKFSRTPEAMDDELLIELVRNHPVLYDLSQPKYMDSNFKQDIWNKIGEEMKVDGSACKSRWNNIRDNYRKSMKKTSTKSGQSAKKIKLYKFSEQLSFLKLYMHERETKGNIASEEHEGNNHDDVVENQEDEEENIQTDAGEPTVLDGGLHEDLQTQPLPSPKPTLEAKVKSLAGKSKKRVAPQQTASAKLMEYLISKQENQTASTPPHPVDAFLAGIAPTLKTLTPYYLNVAKSEIFATVQKYEMQMLINQQSFERLPEPSASTSSTSTPHPSPQPVQEHTTVTYGDQQQKLSTYTSVPNSANPLLSISDWPSNLFSFILLPNLCHSSSVLPSFPPFPPTSLFFFSPQDEFLCKYLFNPPNVAESLSLNVLHPI